MKRQTFLRIGLAIALTFASGCATDIQNIEKLNYASALGIDFRDGKYYGYIQFIQFQAIATTDGAKSPMNMWVGKGVGNSFEEAFFDLYRTAQERIYWGHVTAILITEAALKEGIEHVSDSLSRYYEFRRTPWVFGTREPIPDIFSVTGFFDQSSLNTILHEPEGGYSQASLLKPIKLHRLIAQVYEPGFTSCVPTLAINRKQWLKANKPDAKLMIDGAFFLKSESFRSFIPLEQLSGLRWVESGTIRAGIPVPNPEEPSAQIVVDDPHTKLKVVGGDGDHPQFDIQMKATAYLVNRNQNRLLGMDQLTAVTKKAIEREIKKTYLVGRKKNIDVLNLEHHLYRYHHPLWKALARTEQGLLTEDAIRKVEIELNITHSSSEKNVRLEPDERP